MYFTSEKVNSDDEFKTKLKKKNMLSGYIWKYFKHKGFSECLYYQRSLMLKYLILNALDSGCFI